MANKCKECGCSCKKCLSSDHDVQLHVEIENLKQKLLEKENHIVMMETNFLNETNKFPNGELGALKEELLTWQDKYKRLYEAHRRVQRVNQGLEDKLLKLVDVCETDKNHLTKDVVTLSTKLAEANYAIKKLTEDNDRYKNDVNLAIQFLQCKQTNFVAHRFDSLPSEVQTQVTVYMNNKKKVSEEKNRAPLEPKSIKVPIPTFPPTAMVYSVPKSPKHSIRDSLEDELAQSQVDIVSAAIMAKVLEERQKERALAKHCDTCTCSKGLKIVFEVTHHHIGTQTGAVNQDNNCLKCNENMIQKNSTEPRTLKNIDEKLTRAPYPSLVSPLSFEVTQNIQNVVKVQPNNFLIELTRSNSNHSIDHRRDTLDSREINTKLFRETVLSMESSQKETAIEKNGISSESKDLIDFSEATATTIKEKPLVHHRLCEQQGTGFAVKEQEKLKSDRPSQVCSKHLEVLKGPRFASMKLESGSKNILLDNAHNDMAPVLYTRSQDLSKNKPLSSPQQSRKCLESNPKNQQGTSSVSSHESKKISVMSENSSQHQQRIDEWVQITVENDNTSSPDNSRADDLKILGENAKIIKINKARYAEMEENVKRFLFGESDFWKTVEIGKLKYQSYQKSGKSKAPLLLDENRTSPYTETEI